MTKALKLLVILSVSTLLSYCSKKQEQVVDNVQFTIENKVVTLTEGSNLKGKLKTVLVVEEDFTFDLVTAGIVKAIPNQYAEIASPFSGRVVKTFAKLGQTVGEQTPLFEVSSPDYLELQRGYFEVKQGYKQAALNVKRQEDLLNNGVGVRQEYEEAQTTYAIAKAAYDNVRAGLRIYGVDASALVLGQPLIVRSPIAGEVLENNLVLGQFISDDTAPVVKIASLQKIWIVGKVKEKDIHHLEKLAQVQIELSAYPNAPLSGAVYHISDIVDEETRSIEVLIEVDNDKRILKPGMYVHVRFLDKPEQVMVVPSRAVLQGEDTSFVFIKVGDDKYVKRSVEIGGVSADQTIILSGLDKGDEVVSEGGIYLPQAI